MLFRLTSRKDRAPDQTNVHTWRNSSIPPMAASRRTRARPSGSCRPERSPTASSSAAVCSERSTSTSAVLRARTRRWCRLPQTHERIWAPGRRMGNALRRTAARGGRGIRCDLAPGARRPSVAQRLRGRVRGRDPVPRTDPAPADRSKTTVAVACECNEDGAAGASELRRRRAIAAATATARQFSAQAEVSQIAESARKSASPANLDAVLLKASRACAPASRARPTGPRNLFECGEDNQRRRDAMNVIAFCDNVHGVSPPLIVFSTLKQIARPGRPGSRCGRASARGFEQHRVEVRAGAFCDLRYLGLSGKLARRRGRRRDCTTPPQFARSGRAVLIAFTSRGAVMLRSAGAGSVRRRGLDRARGREAVGQQTGDELLGPDRNEFRARREQLSSECIPHATPWRPDAFVGLWQSTPAARPCPKDGRVDVERSLQTAAEELAVGLAFRSTGAAREGPEYPARSRHRRDGRVAPSVDIRLVRGARCFARGQTEESRDHSATIRLTSSAQ